MNPGAMQLTQISCGPSSAARTRVVLDDPCLRNLVGHPPAVAPAPHAGLRRDGDDLASLAPPAHRRTHLLAAVNRARQVDLHQVAVGLLRRPRGALIGVGGQVAAGVGNQNIDTAELGHRGFHHRYHRVAVRDIRFDPERAPSQELDLFHHGSSGQPFSEFSRRVQPDVVDDDIGSQPGQVQDISASQPSGPTGHEGDFSPKFRLVNHLTAFVSTFGPGGAGQEYGLKTNRSFYNSPLQDARNQKSGAPLGSAPLLEKKSIPEFRNWLLS